MSIYAVSYTYDPADPRVADALRQGGDKGDPVPNIAHLEPAPTLKD